MGEGIRSIRIPIESDLQFQRAFSVSFDRLIRRAVYTTGSLVYVHIYVGTLVVARIHNGPHCVCHLK